MSGTWSGHPPPGPDPRYPAPDLAPVVVGTVIATLRAAAAWHPNATGVEVPAHDSAQAVVKDLLMVAEQLELDPDPAGWMCCPVCEETVCDSGCPLVRFSELRAPGSKP